MTPQQQLAAGLRDIISALESLPSSSGYAVSGAIAKMAVLKESAPKTFQVLCIWITRYSGNWQYGATADVARELGISERAVFKRLSRIMEDPLFAAFLVWNDRREIAESAISEVEVTTYAELARNAGIHRNTLYRWRKSGKV